MPSGWKKDYIRYKEFFLNVKALYDTKPNLKIYLELILSIITVGVFAFFAIKPTILTIIELNKEIQSKTETSAQLKLKVKNLQAASSLMQSRSTDIQLVEQAVPKVAVPEQLVKQIQDESNQNSLQIIGFSISDAVLLGKSTDKKASAGIKPLPNGANELPFTFSATGSYPNIFNFLAKIESFRRPIKIDSYTINSTSTDTEKKIVLTIIGRVPYAE